MNKQGSLSSRSSKFPFNQMEQRVLKAYFINFYMEAGTLIMFITISGFIGWYLVGKIW